MRQVQYKAVMAKSSDNGLDKACVSKGETISPAEIMSLTDSLLLQWCHATQPGSNKNKIVVENQESVQNSLVIKTYGQPSSTTSYLYKLKKHI